MPVIPGAEQILIVIAEVYGRELADGIAHALERAGAEAGRAFVEFLKAHPPTVERDPLAEFHEGG